jgi:hypothetical protein
MILLIVLSELIGFLQQNGNYLESYLNNNPFFNILKDLIDPEKNIARTYAKYVMDKLNKMNNNQIDHFIRNLNICMNNKNVNFIDMCISLVSSFTKKSNTGTIIYLKKVEVPMFLVYAKPNVDIDDIILDLFRHFAKKIIQTLVFNNLKNNISNQLDESKSVV